MKPTPEELWRRIVEPFDDDEEEYESPAEFELRLDREMYRTLSMTPAEIRADLEAMGYDIPTLEREAREFLRRMGWRPRRTPRHLLLTVAAPVVAITALSGVVAPALPQALPMVAQAPTDPPAAVTAAAARPTQSLEDGGSDDTGSR
jgi:hypothetical protein